MTRGATDGLVRKGNPDRQVAANATRYHRYSVRELEALTPAAGVRER